MGVVPNEIEEICRHSTEPTLIQSIPTNKKTHQNWKKNKNSKNISNTISM